MKHLKSLQLKKIFFLLVQRQRSEAFYAAEIAGLNEFENSITAPSNCKWRDKWRCIFIIKFS